MRRLLDIEYERPRLWEGRTRKWDGSGVVGADGLDDGPETFNGTEPGWLDL